MLWKLLLLEGTECTAAWCSMDNWQPTDNHLPVVYTSYKKLKASNEEKRVVLFKMSVTI